MTLSDIETLRPDLLEKVGLLEGKRLIVVGDVGLDEYLFGEVKRISPEAPVPVVEVKKSEFRVGLAANVAQNIHSLGGVAALVGVVGEDIAAKNLQKLLQDSGVSSEHFIIDKSRPTTRKTRVLSGHHHIVRVDFEERSHLSEDVETLVLNKVKGLLTQAEGVVLQDYGKGMLSEGLCKKIIQLTHEAGKRVLVDPHRTTPIRFYKGADLIKPNRDEAFILSGLNIDEMHEKADSIVEVGMTLQTLTQIPNVILTLGKEGVLFFQNNKMTHIPTVPKQVFDVTGAGDTYLAAFSLSWLSGLDPIQSAVLANFASGVVVGKIGSVPCTKAELLAAISYNE